MPNRKQKRRRQKDRRHEYEYVYVDDTGAEVEVEVEVEEDETEKPARSAKAGTRPTGKSGKPGKPGSRQPAKGRAGRVVEPPTWNRVFRRGAIFAPIMLLVVYFLRPKDASLASVIPQVVLLLVFFLPFSYFMDGMMYKQYRKRIGDPLPPRERKPRKP